MNSQHKFGNKKSWKEKPLMCSHPDRHSNNASLILNKNLYYRIGCLIIHNLISNFIQ